MLDWSDLALRYTHESLRLGKVSPGTARSTRHILMRWCDWLDGRPPTRRRLEQWIIDQPALSRGSRRTYTSTCRAWARWLADHGHAVGGADRVTLPPAPRRIPRALPQDRVRRLYAYAPDTRTRAMLGLMFEAALRRAEIAALEIGDWDRYRRTLHVHGKGERDREVPVTVRLERMLDGYLAEWPASAGPLLRSFRSPHGGLSSTTIGAVFDSVARASGVKRRARDGVSPHAARHTRLTQVFEACGDIRVPQQLAGHSDASVTRIYVGAASPTRLREVMELADRGGHCA